MSRHSQHFCDKSESFSGSHATTFTDSANNHATAQTAFECDQTAVCSSLLAHNSFPQQKSVCAVAGWSVPLMYAAAKY